MSSSVYQYALELDGGRTPHFYIGTAGGLRGASMGTPLAAEPVEPPRDRLQRVAGAVLREREPGVEPDP